MKIKNIQEQYYNQSLSLKWQHDVRLRVANLVESKSKHERIQII